MHTDSSTPVLLRRIVELEEIVDRLSQDLGSVRSAMRMQGLRLQEASASRRRGTHASATQDAADAPVPGGLVGACARSEAARVRWVKEGVVVPGEQLARAWGLTRQALAAAAERGELFSVKVGNRLYYPHAFLMLDRESVARVCRPLVCLGSSEQLIFWLREHGSLAGKNIGAALESGVPVAKVERLAGAWARERGTARVAASA